MVKIEFKFPDTGEGVTEGKFLEWKVEEGDEVEEDQIVGEAETDKAVVEIPAPADGKVKDLKASPGDRVEVGDAIMELDTVETENQKETDTEKESGQEKASDSEKIEESPETEERKEASTEESEESEEGSSVSSGDVLALPKVRKLAEEKGVDLASIKTGERITEEEVLEAVEEASSPSSESSNTSGDVSASPSVRRLAREKDIDLEKVDGSGKGGKITREDVLNFESGEASTESSNRTVTGETERVNLSGVQKQVADRMTESRFTAPHVTHIEKADVTKLSEIRRNEKDDVDPHLTYLPFIMKALVPALKNYPELNAELDDENDEIILKNFYCFNIAVDTDRGLLVPKMKNVDRKSILELADEIEEKAEEARNGDLSPDEMSTGSFSISNIGAIGGEAFTPIINYPQTAILGIGRISESAEVVDGEVEPRMTVKLSLSYDHRVIDGATAARFMNEVVENLENPEKMFLNL